MSHFRGCKWGYLAVRQNETGAKRVTMATTLRDCLVLWIGIVSFVTPRGRRGGLMVSANPRPLDCESDKLTTRPCVLHPDSQIGGRLQERVRLLDHLRN